MAIDFNEGVAFTEIADGGMLAGEFEGEQVLVARRGDELFAIGATCTHYGGPLAEGLMVGNRAGNEVRCPWHHACFDLRTGEATRAPALMPVACYSVERRDDQVVITGKKETSPEKVKAPSSLRNVGIIGAGPAGNAAAEMLRRRGYEGLVTLVGAEDPVDRPNLSKDYLAGNAPEEWMPLPTPENIERIARRARSLDRRYKTVAFDDGSSRAFDAILLATGAEPVHLRLPGSDLPHVHYLRTLADSRAIIAGAVKGKRAVILGSSFIGLEVAASLRTREVDVAIVAPETRPLSRVLGEEVGRWIQSLHEEHGVRFHLGPTAKAIEADRVILGDGSEVPADLVVLGVGVWPNVALAEAARIEVDQGIVVDEFLRTSATGIFAAGDVAVWPERISGRRARVEHFVVAERQGQTAAENILGMRKPFRSAPFFWSAHYDVTIAYVGHATDFDAVEVRGSLAGKRALIAYRKSGRILAVATVFMDAESLAIEVALERGDMREVERIVASVAT
jgi:NADPH-dependent 2,4-dienoyl-CoA reductase/sulfur reductase-like enzyme/nitrite reductase/ring-hydroxylating ferredoxin subunit